MTINIISTLNIEYYTKLSYNYKDMTRAEIKKYIKKKYMIDSVSLWADAPTYIVFRNGKNKWFGIIMDVPYNKVYRNSDKDHIIDVMNVKLAPELIASIKNTKGFAPAYHMNKTHWVSIEIGKVSDTKIKELIDMSYNNIL